MASTEVTLHDMAATIPSAALESAPVPLAASKSATEFVSAPPTAPATKSAPEPFQSLTMPQFALLRPSTRKFGA